MMPDTQTDLIFLVNYLIGQGKIHGGFHVLKLRASREQDKMNARDSRAFAYASPSSWAIYCAQVIEQLPRKNRVGILLHEIGHLEINGFKNLDSEVDVDEWIITQVPEARYSYDPFVAYTGAHGRLRHAKNLQSVGVKFLERLGGA